MAVAEREVVEQQAQEVMSGTALARRPGSTPMTPEEWQMIASQSAVYAAAGVVLPKWIKEAGPMAKYVVAAVISKGRELGLQPMYSLEHICMVYGKTMLSSQALLALIQSRHGRKAVTLLSDPNDKETARVRLVDPLVPDDDPLEISFTIERARALGLIKDKEGAAWKSQPEVMLRWRAIAEGARLKFADTISGIYLASEVESVPYKVEGGNINIDFDAIEGEVVKSEVVPTAPPGVDGATGEIVAEAEYRDSQEQKPAVPQPVAPNGNAEARPETMREIDLLANRLATVLHDPTKKGAPLSHTTVRSRAYASLGIRIRAQGKLSQADADQVVDHLKTQLEVRANAEAGAAADTSPEQPALTESEERF